MKFPLVWRKRLVESERVRVDLEGSNNALRQMVKDLQAQLRVAQRNDHHDPVTGRFTKAD